MPLPAGVLIPGSPATLASVFGALVALQPIEWTREGLVCAPRAGEPAEAATVLDRCPVLWRMLEAVPAWPTMPARMMGGWYVRTEAHAPAPTGVRELLQTVGDAFGPQAHPTTTMCLQLIDTLPGGAAIDVGCGSGLLMQAWIALGHGTAIGVDIDDDAVAHARASLALAGLDAMATLVCGPLAPVLAERPAPVWLVNLPPIAHDAVKTCLDDRGLPNAIVCAGFRTRDRGRVLTGYRQRGFRAVRASRRSGWECWSLAR